MNGRSSTALHRVIVRDLIIKLTIYAAEITNTQTHTHTHTSRQDLIIDFHLCRYANDFDLLLNTQRYGLKSTIGNILLYLITIDSKRSIIYYNIKARQ